MARLRGKVALVSGGSSGIGEATVRRFTAESAEVVILDVDEERGRALHEEMGDSVVFVRTDVTDSGQWLRAVDRVLAQHGKVDVLVNCAGGGRGGGPIAEEHSSTHQRIVDLNLRSVWNGIRAVLPPMTGVGGSIVNISSIDGLVGARGSASYVASKFAVTGLTRAAALDLGPSGVRVNAVHPGFVETPLLAGREPTLRAELMQAVRTQPISRFGRPDEIASAVLFFASDESGFCTGASLVVDGGKTAGSR